MSLTRSKYRKLGLELVSLEDNNSHMPKKPSMVEENKNDREADSINMLLEQALTRQRDEIMENFAHILQCMLIESGISSSSGHFGGTSPFKVQVNFDIPASICPSNTGISKLTCTLKGEVPPKWPLDEDIPDAIDRDRKSVV